MLHENAMSPDTGSVGRMAELLATSSGASAAAFGTVNVETRAVQDIWASQSGKSGSTQASASTKHVVETLLEFAGTKVFEDAVAAQAPKGSGNLWSFSPQHVVCIGSLETHPMLHFVVFLFAESGLRDNEDIRNLARIGVNFVGTLTPSTTVIDTGPEVPSVISQSVLKCLSFGYMVLDSSARIRALKDSADGWLANSSAFEVKNERLTATRRRDQKILSEAIEAASGPQRKTSVLLLDRTQSISKETVYLMPIDGSDGLVLLTFGQDHNDSEIRNIALEAMGLTPAERSVTQGLVDGKSLQEAANDAKVTISTARSYLKSIFQKTGMKSQSQLVTLCLNLTPAISNGNSAPSKAVGKMSPQDRRPARLRS